jgi:hypothetical protein
LNVRSKGATYKTQEEKRMNDNLFEFFEKIIVYPSLVLAPYLPQILSILSN